jgi:hypothetical protein
MQRDRAARFRGEPSAMVPLAAPDPMAVSRPCPPRDWFVEHLVPAR